MSWGVSKWDVPYEEFDSALTEEFERQYSEPAPGMQAAFEAAKVAIKGLGEALDQHAAAESYNVSASGHASAHSEDSGGNYVTVSVSMNRRARDAEGEAELAESPDPASDEPEA